MLTNTHPVADHRADLFSRLALGEGFGKPANRPGLPYFDDANPPRATIGYGFNLEDRNVARLVLAQIGVLAGKIDSQVLQIESDFRAAINAGRGGPVALEASLDAFAQAHGVAGGKFKLTDDPQGFGQGRQIFDQILIGVASGGITGNPGSAINVEGKESRLNDILLNSGIAMDTKEYVALMSLFYNAENLVRRGGKLVTAILDDNRAEAWYQIRYNSNNGNTRNTVAAQGLANRRFKEGDLFGLYGSGPISDTEAKQILQMYTRYRDLPLAVNGLRAYEAQFPPTNPNAGSHVIDFEISPARGRLIDNFAEGRTINGEVLVGRNDLGRGDIFDGTANGDLLFGEQGADVLRGGAGTDVLYGGEGIDELSGDADADLLRGEAGNDTLQGGTGDDLLEGGAGFDTYLYTTGDGHDRIEDSDANGVIIVNGKPLVGGVKKAGHTDWTSPDGTLKYIMLGTDLVVQLSGTTILTVNENFQSGQFGIDLIDAPTISTSLPTTTRTIGGDFDPLDTDPGAPGLQIDYDDLGNVIQDTASPNDRSDVLNGSAGNDTINGGALNDRLTALGGSDILTGGSDNDVLIGQDGNDQLFADQFVNVSGLTTLENFGGTAGTGANGDFLTGGVNDDVLVGGTGNDALYGDPPRV